MEEITTTPPKKERIFPRLDLSDQSTLTAAEQPVLIVQSPKTPTLSKKLKAVSLDSDPPAQSTSLEVSRDVFSMPNTPKRQIKQKLSCDFEDGPHKSMLAPSLNSNLKKFASNTSISGSQTLKTLPEVMTLHDFSDGPVTIPVKIKAKGLLERRGSNASLTIDLGSNPSIADVKPVAFNRLNTAKSVSNLNLSTFDSEKCCNCSKKCEAHVVKSVIERRKSQETCGNCTIYEAVPSIMNSCKIVKCQQPKRCSCCPKTRRKSLSNENLYIPPCGFCQTGALKECTGASKHCKGYRKAYYPRQPDLETTQLLSEDFKLHLENIRYLETAGNVLTIEELKKACEIVKCQQPKRCSCCPKTRRKSLSNENLYIPPCGFCQTGALKECTGASKHCKGYRKAYYPRQPDLETTQLLSEDFKLHLENIRYLETAGNVLTIEELKKACEVSRVPKLHQEFWEVPLNLQEKCYVSGSQSRNRYKGVLPNEHSRVHLPGSQTYIHANYIKGPDYTETLYIATQGPMAHTCQDFWEMVWNTHVSLLLCILLKLITYLNENSIGECHIRQLRLQKLDSAAEPRKISHYWFSNWPDHKMACPEQVLKIALDVLNAMHSKKKSTDNNVNDISKKFDESLSKSTNCNIDLKAKSFPDNFDCSISKKDKILALSKGTPEARRKSMENLKLPVIVHCSAGIGRTGCFIAILNGIQQLKANSNVDILAILCSLRLNRGGMVQTAEQYELIHRVLSLYTENMT
uniref:protein-tyrosine-phosphatase n=1 Tax=Diabrotica virgifera virgifera TaxID=50390 RepID=A0A6P7FFS1_DIAVI